MPGPANSLNISEAGFQTFDGTSIFHGRTLTAGTGISITNPDGIVGNPVISVTSGGTVIETITGNTGGAESPLAGNFNILGTGSITVAGSANTETVQLTGLTNHAVLVGAGTATITNLAIGTTGQVLTGVTGSDPIWASPAASSISLTGDTGGPLVGSAFTITGGTTGMTFAGSGTTLTLSGILALANGGTNANLTASNGGIFYSTATAGAILSGTATAGQIIRSGASTAPTWSTATYPATAGTSGNVLTSDGTNWISSAASGAGLLSVSGNLTNAQIKALHGTPIQIVAAPGAGKVIEVISASTTMNYGGTNVFTALGSGLISYWYGTATIACAGLSNPAIVNAGSVYNKTSPSIVTAIPYSSVANAALNLYNNSATEIAGNAANDNTASYNVIYRVITIP